MTFLRVYLGNDFPRKIIYLLPHSRPIGIQLALKEKNLVLWLDIDYRLNTNDLR